MSEHDLRHLAVISGTAPDQPDDLGGAVLASCAKAVELARAAFDLAPGLRAFSWLDPGLDGLLARATAREAATAGSAGARQLGVATAGLGVSLRLCGRTDDLSGVAPAGPAAAADGRKLLWFYRYSGRDEIVRAAGRFIAAHPGTPLPDGELDAWLDTAGLPDPDLLLYVGGTLEPRDVLLWQGSYAEISHTPERMSSFSAAGIRRAIDDFSERQRTFGR